MSEQKVKTRSMDSFTRKAEIASNKFRTIRKKGRYLSIRRYLRKKGVVLRNGEEIEF